MRSSIRDLGYTQSPRNKMFSVSAIMTPRQKSTDLSTTNQEKVLLQKNRKIHLKKIREQIS